MGKWKATRTAVTIYDMNWGVENVDPELVRYIRGQIEQCPTTGREHYQLYVEWLIQMTSRKRCQRALHAESCHVEIVRGTRSENVEYCTKGDCEVQIEWGTPGSDPVENSTRTDLIGIKRSLDSGEKLSQIALNSDNGFRAFIKYARNLEKYEDILVESQIKPWDPCEVIVIYGEAGSGKSKFCLEECQKHGGGYYRPVIGNCGLWFNKYKHEKAIILDDFYGQIRFSEMLKLLDGYKYEIERKGSTTWGNWNKIYITSNVHPENWWTGYDKIPRESVAGFQRRIVRIIHKVRTAKKRKISWAHTETLNEDNIKVIPAPTLRREAEYIFV